jgi:hypothetical protein
VTDSAIQSEFRAIFREEMTALRAELAPAKPKPALLDTKDLAFELKCCTKTVDRLRKAGMPCVLLGDNCPRFVLADCLAWLKARGS